MPRQQPARRNAPKGSTVARKLLQLTAEAKADLEALSARWGEPNANEVVRRALRAEAKRIEVEPE